MKTIKLVHYDVYGVIKQPLVREMWYVVVFTDNVSGFTWDFFMKEK